MTKLELFQSDPCEIITLAWVRSLGGEKVDCLINDGEDYDTEAYRFPVNKSRQTFLQIEVDNVPAVSAMWFVFLVKITKKGKVRKIKLYGIEKRSRLCELYWSLARAKLEVKRE